MILTEKQQKYRRVKSSGKINKNEYLTGEEILPPHQSKMIHQGKFAYSPLGKPFPKQIKLVENQCEKQIKAIEVHRKKLVKSSCKKDF